MATFPSKVIILTVMCGKIHKTVVESEQRNLSMEILVFANPIAAEFEAIERELGMTEKTAETYRADTDYTDDYSAQWRDAVTGWMS